MKIRQSALVVALVAGGLAPLASAQVQTKAPHHGRQRLQTLAPAGRLEPVAVAKARKVNGQIIVVGDWQPYVRPAGSDVPDQSVFDLYEGDALGAPTNFCTSGCTQLANCPAAGPGTRWFFGPTAVNPHYANDMASIRTGYNNAQAKKVRFAWNWGAGASRDMYVAVFTAETFNDCTVGPPATANDFAGVVYGYAPSAGGLGYFYSEVDLSNDPLLFHQMPADGAGAYEMALANFQDPLTGALTLDNTPGTQPMLWGTGEDEVPADGRFGTQDAPQWDDDFPLDGTFGTGECYSYAQTGDICPNPLGAMIEFLAEPVSGGCYANCDQSTTIPILNVQDFTCFLQRYAAGESYANCDQSTTPPVLNVQDFTCFLQSYAAGCP